MDSRGILRQWDSAQNGRNIIAQANDEGVSPWVRKDKKYRPRKSVLHCRNHISDGNATDLKKSCCIGEKPNT
jgi:hypothetical protein